MASSKIKDVIAYLESLAPPSYQESYDNSGQITGSPEDAVKAILVTLDCTEDVVEEAASLGCNMIVSHHPILFRPIKRLTGATYVERTLVRAIQKSIAIYAMHTNLDNVIGGVNKTIADAIGLNNRRILSPMKGALSKLVTFIPAPSKDKVLTALYNAGAGQVGRYTNCSFQVTGMGIFVPGSDTNPHIGTPGKTEEVEEVRVELIVPHHKQDLVIAALKGAHPYEEVAYYLTPLSNEDQDVGPGLIGELSAPEEPLKFLTRLKHVMHAKSIRHTALPSHPVKRVAVCGGAGSFLLPHAIRHGADVFVSADFKYHEFFDADNKIIVADVGHYESEQFTKDLILKVLTEKFTTFASHFSKTVTNPISHL